MGDELGLDGWILTDHARDELARRRIPVAAIREILRVPGQRLAVRPGREIWQALWLPEGSPRPYLVPVVVEIDREPREVVTAHRTSKIRKYWREG